VGAGHGLGWSRCLAIALGLPGASDQDGQGLHCGGVLGWCHGDRLGAGHHDFGLGGAGTLGGGPGPSAGSRLPTTVRSGLACHPEPGAWTLALAAAVKLNRGRGGRPSPSAGSCAGGRGIGSRPACRRTSLTVEKTGFRARS